MMAPLEAGGATERFGVTPDMVTLAKALGAGLPMGAIGGSEDVFSVVEDGSVFQVGTYNGNPLGVAAARANLFEVMTPGGVQAPRHPERPPGERLPGRSSTSTTCPATRSASPPRAA